MILKTEIYIFALKVYYTVKQLLQLDGMIVLLFVNLSLGTVLKRTIILLIKQNI